jgi:large subunit ribosomal protein L15
MALTLHTLRPGKGAKSSKRRVGRGLGSRGTTAGRGQKGQTSRSGVGGLKRLGMRHLILATPKVRGFKSMHGKPQAINLSKISQVTIAGEMVTPRTLAKKGVILDATTEVKILAGGEITHAIILKNCTVSVAAKAKIEEKGGRVEA